MSNYDVTTFGEGQIRLTVPSGDRLLTAHKLAMSPAGSEANVAGLLAQLKHRTAWGSVVPAGELGDRIINEYRAVGVDTSHVVRSHQGRVALYFLEPGEHPMPGKVTYDREHTPFREVTADQFDLDALLDTRMLFLTGITAALTPSTRTFVTTLIAEARRRGVPVAYDVNHRTLLWDADQARAALSGFIDQLDLLFCSRLDARLVLGLDVPVETAAKDIRQATGVGTVVTTDQLNPVTWASAEDSGTCSIERVPVKDRPGAGDAFVSGVIDGHLRGDLADGIARGTFLARLALTHHGDLTSINASDLAVLDTSDIVR